MDERRAEQLLLDLLGPFCARVVQLLRAADNLQQVAEEVKVPLQSLQENVRRGLTRLTASAEGAELLAHLNRADAASADSAQLRATIAAWAVRLRPPPQVTALVLDTSGYSLDPRWPGWQPVMLLRPETSRAPLASPWTDSSGLAKVLRDAGPRAARAALHPGRDQLLGQTVTFTADERGLRVASR